MKVRECLSYRTDRRHRLRHTLLVCLSVVHTHNFWLLFTSRKFFKIFSYILNYKLNFYNFAVNCIKSKLNQWYFEAFFTVSNYFPVKPRPTKFIHKRGWASRTFILFLIQYFSSTGVTENVVWNKKLIYREWDLQTCKCRNCCFESRQFHSVLHSHCYLLRDFGVHDHPEYHLLLFEILWVLARQAHRSVNL